MDATLKNKWIEALRSGEYKQGKGFLRKATPNGDCYCVMGVFCDIFDNTKWHKEPGINEYFHKGRSGNPDDFMLNTAGIDNSTKWYLMNMNDNIGYTFEKIANWIEECV